jgi:ADP-ribosylglycohydrolase
LRAGIPAERAAEIGNPYSQYIGADIRSDPWAYAAPGLPEKAAELAYRDAYLSHRRNGIYGAMYFSAVISAAFTVEDPVDALVIGLEEIPRDCLFAQGIRWSLDIADQIKDYRDANAAITEAYGGMHIVHAINNGCLTVWGLTIGGRDFTKVIGETVAMSFDNDCTAATAGSIAGAVLAKDGVPEHWWKNFNNKSLSYLNGHSAFEIDDLVDRFTVQAQRVFGVI